MTAKSHSNGWTIEYNEHWIYSDNKKDIKMSRKCKNCRKESEIVRVWMHEDLSHTGKARWANKGIDACIASIVKALQKGGINMRSSCCGHGKGDGEILLQDGRRIIIKKEENNDKIKLRMGS